MSRGLFAAISGASLLLAGPVFAHDPYEITSTANVLTNTIEVEVEMEFRTALRLAGIEITSPLPVVEEVMAARRMELLATAGAFLQLDAGGNRLVARATNVTLGVEQHVQFRLEFPVSHFRPLHFNAEGLKTLAGQGAYGTTLTVLDRVNLTVLGQTVLYPAATTSEFGVTTDHKTATAVAPPIHVECSQLQPTNVLPAPVTVKTNADAALARLYKLILVGAVLIGLTAILWWRRRGWQLLVTPSKD